MRGKGGFLRLNQASQEEGQFAEVFKALEIGLACDAGPVKAGLKCGDPGTRSHFLIFSNTGYILVRMP